MIFELLAIAAVVIAISVVAALFLRAAEKRRLHRDHHIRDRHFASEY